MRTAAVIVMAVLYLFPPRSATMERALAEGAPAAGSTMVLPPWAGVRR